VSAPTPARLDIEGELTILTATEHFGRLRALLADGADLDIGLSGVTDIDTAGLQVLLLARREAHERGVTVGFREPSGAVGDALAVVHAGPEFGFMEVES
jgi:anti-anti-sigma regulatory factor